MPKSGLSVPRNAANGPAIHALGTIDKGTKTAGAPTQSRQASGAHAPKAGMMRISTSLGEVKLNFHKVTHGLAHSAVAPGQVRNANASTDTVWSDSKASTTTAAANSSTVTAVTVSGSGSAASALSTSSSATTAVATTAGSASDNSGGNNGNNGNSDNGNRGATGNGNNGNGGDSGNHYGLYKHH